MQTKTINKSIEIKAGRERVWQVLTQQPYADEVISIFMEGSTVKGEFKIGGEIIYSDPSGAGVVGKVSEYKPNEKLKVSIVAELIQGQQTLEPKYSEKWEGCFDQYELSEKDGVTTLTIESVCPEEHYKDDFLPGWDKMLGKIKELAEK